MIDLLASLGEQGIAYLLLAIALGAIGWLVKQNANLRDKWDDERKEHYQSMMQIAVDAFKSSETLRHAIEFVSKSKGGE